MLLLSEEATTIYHTRSEHANHYITGIVTKIKTNNTTYIVLSVERFFYSYCSTMFVLFIRIAIPCLYYYLFTVSKYNSKDICLDDSYNEYENPYSAFCGSVTFSVIDDVPVCFMFYDPYSSTLFPKLRYCSATVEINKKRVLVSFK